MYYIVAMRRGLKHWPRRQRNRRRGQISNRYCDTRPKIRVPPWKNYNSPTHGQSQKKGLRPEKNKQQDKKKSEQSENSRGPACSCFSTQLPPTCGAQIHIVKTKTRNTRSSCFLMRRCRWVWATLISGRLALAGLAEGEIRQSK